MMMDDAMNALAFDERIAYEERLKQHEAIIETGKGLIGVSEGQILVADRYGRDEAFPCDSVEMAIELRPRRGLIEQIKKETDIDVFEVGDLVKPRKIMDAIHKGFKVARWV